MELTNTTRNYVCYAWHEVVEGYSKFGTFEGNSDANDYLFTQDSDQDFVYCKITADATGELATGEIL